MGRLSVVIDGTTQRKVVVFGALLLLFSAVLAAVLPQSASATMATNSRLNYGNAGVFCTTGNGSGPSYWAKGMVWLSNQPNYYSEVVAIGTSQNSVLVSVRGAVNACQTSWPGARDMYAINVSTNYLSGMSGNSFYRGRVPAAGNYAWSTEGSRLYGTLNVSNVALCGPASLTTGVSNQTIFIDIRRQQQQRAPDGTITYTSNVVGVETVPVNVRRTCPIYNYQLNPTITSVTDQGSIETPLANLGVTGAVRNQGPTASRPNPSWRITQVVYDRDYLIPPGLRSVGGTSPAATLPCTFYTAELECRDVATGTQGSYPNGATVSHSGSTSVNEWPMGTQICFVMSVSLYDQTNNGWRHSPIVCYRVGVKPKTNIIGGDLYVGRKPVGMTTAVTARVVTSQSRNSTGTYGSWAEYAVAAAGPVTYMGSGSGYVGGTSSYLDLLTFYNQGNSATTCATSEGCYVHNTQLPSIASRFPTNGAPTFGGGSLNGRSGIHTASGAITIDASSIQAGQSFILNAPDAAVTITGDIRYNPGVPLSQYDQIPQVVIIANNITITQGVSNVDAWLIAPGTVQSDGSVTGGTIRTCDVAPGNLSASVCNSVLTVNGPVIANRLVLLRTGGAGTGADSGNPAEIFNFRPDAYLWALNQGQTSGRVTTVETKELPPRY